MRLEKPNTKFKKTFINGFKEIIAFEEKNDSTDWYKKLNLYDLENDFDSYILSILEKEKGKNLEEGHVPRTMFWMLDDKDNYLGRISLRHYLNEELNNFGGHIGYDVIPSERKKSYASTALALCLKEAKKLGIDKTLLICDEDNFGSIKTIEKNGGVYQDKVMQDNRLYILRYWISL